MDVTVSERRIPYEEMPYFLKLYDIFIDRHKIPSFSKTCLEAMSCGLATIDFRHMSEKEEGLVDNNDLKTVCKELLDKETVRRIGHQNRIYVEKFHNVEMVSEMLSSHFNELLEGEK